MYFLYEMRFMMKPYSTGLYVNILGDDIDTKYTEQGGAESCFNTGWVQTERGYLSSSE